MNNTKIAIGLIEALLDTHTKEEVISMSEQELRAELADQEHEYNVGQMEDEQERRIYGDPEHDDYTMSDSYRADCQAEQWDWLKNECN